MPFSPIMAKFQRGKKNNSSISRFFPFQKSWERREGAKKSIFLSLTWNFFAWQTDFCFFIGKFEFAQTIKNFSVLRSGAKILKIKRKKSLRTFYASTRFHSTVLLNRSEPWHLVPMLWFLKYFRPKNRRKMAFLTQNNAKFWKNLIKTLVFEKNDKNWRK
jgi:hypothetical protein